MTENAMRPDEANGLLEYINSAPTPYHSTEYLAAMLDEAGAVRLKEEDAWGDILPGMIYYFTRNDSALAAFRLGDEPPVRKGLRIAAAHHDAPGFRVKPASSAAAHSYERLLLEPYGGLIHHTWTDRPLALAGRVYTKSSYSDGITGVNINIRRPLLVIPGPAIHMARDINEKAAFNPQTELLPFFAQDFDDRKSFLSYIAGEAAVEEDDVLSFDLMPYDAQPACLTGLSDEFISAPRLDDYAMVYSVFRGFIDSADSSTANAVALAFDHEECGSQSDRGARSNLLEALWGRLAEKLGYDAEEQYCTLARSILFSADMAHATHPAYPDRYDRDHPVYLNKGPVLKTNANQSYSSAPRSAAFFRKICAENGIPHQEFVNRSDARGGSTIGPVLAARYGMLTLDVGNPMLSMHAMREFGGTLDVEPAVKLFAALYED